MITKLIDFSNRGARGIHRRVQTFVILRALRSRGLAQAPNIPTFTVRDELEALFHLSHACKSNARILEIGSYLGASTAYLIAGLKDQKSSITCIDTWQNQTMPDGVHDTFAMFEHNLRPVSGQITTIRKTSDEVTPEDVNEKFDLIFLDGDHSYNQTKKDFERFSGFLSDTGTLAFHDSLFFEGVSRVIGEALSSAQWQIGGSVRNLFWIRRANFEHKS